MTVLDSPSDRHKFGVGARIGDTMSIFGARFPVFAAIAIVCGIIGQLPSFLLTGMVTSSSPLREAREQALAATFKQAPLVAAVVTTLLPFLVYTVMSGIFVMAAYDTRMERPARILSYVGAVLAKIVPLFLVALVVGAAIGAASVALVVPGLWVMGVFSVVVPTIMLENAGFGSMSRSTALTKEYRWPLVGFLILVYILTAILNLAVAIATMAVPAVVGVALTGAVDGITAALVSIGVTVAYLRLIELKEGRGSADVASVFS